MALERPLVLILLSATFPVNLPVRGMGGGYDLGFIQTPAPCSNVRRSGEPASRALPNYIQLDIIRSCGRCISLAIRSSASETSQRTRGMMRVINSTKFSEAINPTT